MPRTFLDWSWWMSWWGFVKVDRCVVAAGTVRFIFRCFYSGADWRVTTLVPFSSIFIFCVFLVSLWREYWRICALSPPGQSVLSFVLVNPLYFVSGWLLRYDAGTDWVCFTFYAFLVSSWRAARCVDAVLRSILPCSLLSSRKFVQRGLLQRRRCYSKIFSFFVFFVLIFREDLIDASMPRLPSVFFFSFPVK